MNNFNFYDFQNLRDNQILKIKMKGKEEWIYVRSVTKSVLQSYQPAFTPITKINLEVINDISLYKIYNHNVDNLQQVSVEPEEVDQFEVTEL